MGGGWRAYSGAIFCDDNIQRLHTLTHSRLKKYYQTLHTDLGKKQDVRFLHLEASILESVSQELFEGVATSLESMCWLLCGQLPWSSATLPACDPMFRFQVTMLNKRRRDKTARESEGTLVAFLGKKADYAALPYNLFITSLQKFTNNY